MISKELTKYSKFNTDISNKIEVLTKFKGEIECITPFTLSIAKFSQIGHIMWSFYQLYNSPEYHDAILYSFGFNGYMNLMCGLKSNIDNFKLNKTTFIKKRRIIRRIF